jgi:hypothetical protein
MGQRHRHSVRTRFLLRVTRPISRLIARGSWEAWEAWGAGGAWGRLGGGLGAAWGDQRRHSHPVVVPLVTTRRLLVYAETGWNQVGDRSPSDRANDRPIDQASERASQGSQGTIREGRRGNDTLYLLPFRVCPIPAPFTETFPSPSQTESIARHNTATRRRITYIQLHGSS